MPERKFRCLRKNAKPWKKALATQMRRNMTWPERRLWSKMKEKQLGVPCYAQSVVLGYILDFWIPSAGICVELDGVSHKTRKEYDHNRDAVLKKRGIVTMRFKNEDVVNNQNAVLSLVLANIRQRLK